MKGRTRGVEVLAVDVEGKAQLPQKGEPVQAVPPGHKPHRQPLNDSADNAGCVTILTTTTTTTTTTTATTATTATTTAQGKPVGNELDGNETRHVPRPRDPRKPAHPPRTPTCR